MRFRDWSSDVCSPDLGSDVSVIGYGLPIADAHAIATRLADEGISVEVIDLRTIAPLDMETLLKSVAKTKRAVIVHEAVRNFGVGAEIATRINEELFGQLAAPVRRVASKKNPVQFSATLQKAFIWNQGDIEKNER